MRQRAWLQAVPQEATPATRAVAKGIAEKPKSRWDDMLAKGIEPPLPEIEFAGYLIDYLMEIGPALQGGAGPAVISQGEIRAWQQNTGIELMPWESTLLRRLSFEWIGEQRLAESPDRPAPWGSQVTDVDRDVVARKVALAFKGRATGRRQKGKP